MAQKRSFEQPMPPESCWIKYQLDLRDIKYDEIAEKARRTTAFVSMVICRKRKSEIVEAILAEMLGMLLTKICGLPLSSARKGRRYEETR